jgi:hypothetical protein
LVPIHHHANFSLRERLQRHENGAPAAPSTSLLSELEAAMGDRITKSAPALVPAASGGGAPEQNEKTSQEYFFLAASAIKIHIAMKYAGFSTPY